MSRPKAKVWDQNEGCFTNTDENDDPNRGRGHPQGQNRGQRRDSDQPRNQGQDNRGQNLGQQRRGQNQGQQRRGQNQGQQNRGQNQGQQNRGQNQGQQNREQNQRQQNRGQNQGQPNVGQNQWQQNRDQNQGQQYRGQNQGQQYRDQNQGQQYRGQNQGQQYRGQNQGQPYGGQNQGQQYRGQYQGQQNRGQNQEQHTWQNRQGQRENPNFQTGYGPGNQKGPRGYQGQHQQEGLLPEPEQQPYGIPPPNMQYPQMMAAPMYQPVMMQPVFPMYPMQSQASLPPHSPPQPQPLVDVQTGYNENYRKSSENDNWQNNRGRGRQNNRGRGGNHFGRGRQERGGMNRASSTMSVDSIGSESEDTYGRNRGNMNSRGHMNNRGRVRGNMGRSLSSMSIDSWGSQPEENQGQNPRHRSGRGRQEYDRSGVNSRQNNSGVPDNPGRGLGARPKEFRNVPDGSNVGRAFDKDNRNKENQDEQRGRIRGRGRVTGRGRGRGRGNQFPWRGRPIINRNASVSDGSDQQSVCSISDDNDNVDPKMQGYLYNNIRNKVNIRTRGRDRRDIAGTHPVGISGYTEYMSRFTRRGSFRGFQRGRGSFRDCRGRLLQGKWVGRKKDVTKDERREDSSSTIEHDDFDDSMSITSDVSFTPSSIADDISDSGLLDGKSYEICLDDIQTVKLRTLRNRITRYKRKLADMRKKNEDKDVIKDYQSQVEEIKKVLKERETSGKMKKEKKIDCSETKGNREVQNNDKKYNKLSSEDSEEEVIRKQNHTKSKRMHAVLALKGHVSYKPKSRKKVMGKSLTKKNATESPSTESEDEIEDNISDEEDGNIESDKNETDQKKKKRKRIRNKRKKITNDGKTNVIENRLTDILSKLDTFALENRSETKSVYDSSTDSNAGSRSRKNSVNDSGNISKAQPKKAKAKDTQPDTTERKRNTSESKLQGPDVNEVFRFMVTTLEGKGTPEEIKRESGLFPIGCDEVTWFRKFKRRFILIEQNGVVEMVLVSNRDATYCLDYITNRSCKKEECKRYHICKHLLAGNCVYGNGCKFSHDFLDKRNISISTRLGYSNVFTSDEICSILRVRYPHTCSNWIGHGTCENLHCINLHLCPRYILGQCLEGEKCQLIHDKCSDHNKPIVEAYGMTNWIENVFKKMIFMTREPSIETRENNKSNEAVTEVLYQREGQGSSGKENQWEIEDSAISKPICEKYLTGKCRRQRCKFLHCKNLLPYLWQVKLYDTWINLEQLVEIEKAFCNNQEFSDEIRLVHNGLEFSIVVVLSPQIQAVAMVIGTGDGGTHTEARRLSTSSYKEADCNPDSFKTQWRWYWVDDGKRWLLFEPDAMQHTLEVKYLAKQTEFNYSRENYRFKYILDFSEMSQLNIDTRKRRKISRRPLFVSLEDVLNKHYPKCLSAAPVVETRLPESWVPWDLAYPFELVRIEKIDPKYAHVSESFFKTLERRTIEIDAIFRMQNHKLWSLYCNQERIMEANLKRLGRETAVDKRDLFHGTDSLDAVRGISINNFDVRVSGKNATMYGDGAYFARDAKYSHSYTKGPERFMFMVTVLVGQYTKGDRSYRRPPNKPGSDHELYDSCVNDISNPSIFIVFDKNQYYPEYLVQYHVMHEETDIYTQYPRPAPRTTRAPGQLGANVIPQRPSSPVLPKRRSPPSTFDTSFTSVGGTTSQNPGGQSRSFSPPYPSPTEPAVKSLPVTPKKKDDSCSIQ